MSSIGKKYNGFTEEEILTNALSARMLDIFDICDKHDNRYNSATEEYHALRQYAQEKGISFPSEIAMRF